MDIIAIAHDGELVCESCLASDAERAVFYDAADAHEAADTDGYLSPVFAHEVTVGDTCGRCERVLVDPDDWLDE